MPLLPHQQRVIDEKNELKEKTDKLQQFIGSDAESGKVFHELPAEDKELLLTQHSIMTQYAQVLDKRISRFPK